MADDPENQPTETNDVRQLREALARRDEQIKGLNEQVSSFRNAALAGVVHRAGYDPNGGPVRLVMEKFEADMTPDKLTPESFAEYAKQWGVEPAPQTPQQPQQQQPGQPVVQQPQQPVDPAAQQQMAQVAQQVAQSQSPADQLQAAAQMPPAPTSQADVQRQIAEAEANKDWERSFALKVGSVPRVPDQFGAMPGTGFNPDTNLPTHSPPPGS